MLFTSWTCENYKELHYSIAEDTVSFHGCLYLCLHFFSTFEQKHCSQQKSFTPSSAATGVKHSALPHHWGHFSKDQAGDNLMVNGQSGCDNTIHPKIMIASHFGMRMALFLWISYERG
jgi:hypothetical protein